MSKYVKKRVGDICSIRRGASPRPIDEWMSEEGVPWVKISDATKDDGRFISKTDGFIKPDGAEKSVEVWPGDLIISNSATPALPKIMNIHACIHDGWLLAENFKGVTRDYLYYQIKFLKKYLINQGNGSIFKNLKTEILRDFPIVIPVTNDGNPNEKEQDKLTDVLINIENKIENNNKIISTLESLAKTIYDYWFLQFEFPNEDGKPYKSSGGKMVWNDELKREIPEGWGVTNVGNITTCLDSKRVPLSSKDRESMKGPYPYYGATSEMDSVNEYLFDGDYVLLAEDGSVMDDNGFPILQRTSGKVWVNNHAHVLQPKKPYGCKLLMFILKNIPVSMIKTGSIQMKVNQENLNAFKVLSIPENLIEKANSILNPIDAKIIMLKQENQELASLRDFLLPMLMNGQVTFKEEDE